MDSVECDQIVELKARREVDGGLDEAKGKLASLSVVGFFWGDSVEGLEKELVKLTILMSVWHCLGDGNDGVMIENSGGILIISRLLRDTRNHKI